MATKDGIRSCTLYRWPASRGLGFTVHSAPNRRERYIAYIEPRSSAAYSGLRLRDRIVEINGINICTIDHDAVIDLIKSSEVKIVMLVVDEKTDIAYREQCRCIQSALPEVVHMEGPAHELVFIDESQEGSSDTSSVETEVDEDAEQDSTETSSASASDGSEHSDSDQEEKGSPNVAEDSESTQTLSYRECDRNEKILEKADSAARVIERAISVDEADVLASTASFIYRKHDDSDKGSFEAADAKPIMAKLAYRECDREEKILEKSDSRGRIFDCKVYKAEWRSDEPEYEPQFVGGLTERQIRQLMARQKRRRYVRRKTISWAEKCDVFDDL